MSPVLPCYVAEKFDRVEGLNTKKRKYWAKLSINEQY